MRANRVKQVSGVLVVAVVATGCAIPWGARDEAVSPHPFAQVCKRWSIPDGVTPTVAANNAEVLTPEELEAFTDEVEAYSPSFIAGRCLRLNQLQVIGSHNSYHVQPQEPLWSALKAFDPGLAAGFEYTHSPLGEQFSDEAVRQIELDVFADPDGGHYADRHLNPLFGLPLASGIPELDEPGFKVFHVQEVDYETTCISFVECLEQIETWSNANPNHLPLAVLVELKDDVIPDPINAGFTQPIQIEAEHLDALDAEIRSVFDESEMITPDQVRGGAATLESAILTNGWPTIEASRGKVMFLMDNEGSERSDYLAGHPTLEGRPMFVSSAPGQPSAAFVKRNNPLGANTTAIQDLVAAGYLVRTRADGDTVQARSGDTTQRDAALESGAQWISTDYPVVGRAAMFGTDYVARIPDGQPARCNPVNSGPGCQNSALEPASGDGFVDNSWMRARQRAYLDFATTSLQPRSITNVIAHAAAGNDISSVHVADFQTVFDRIDTLRDTTDFDLLYLLNLWLPYRDQLDPALRAEIESKLHTFKYWFTEPTPPGRVDDRWYWSENHRIIFHTLEYLAGDAFAGDVFTNDGRTGAVHRDEAKQRIEEWLDEKVRFGWSEWHSDVYYQKDATPLLTLVEHAPDPEIAQKAAMVLDLLLLDIAMHLQNGNFGATHGRSYMKDKSVATDQDTFAMSKLLFADTDVPYPSASDAGAVLFARAEKYRLPEAIRRIAISKEVSIDRERMNVPLDPLAEIDLNAPAPYGYDFNDPANVGFWWERGNQTTWQGVELTFETLTQHGLWESEFFSPFIPLRDAVNSDPALARPFARALAPMLAFGLLSEINSYTYRAPEVMLSTAQHHRPGMFADQHHAWQATLDESAIVFTTHAKNEPEIGSQWPDRDGYWTGTGSMPSSVQHGAAGIHVYDPAFDAPGPGALETFNYIELTHAYFPQEKFDEVVTHAGGHWVFGRQGKGFVVLWSERPVEWRDAPPGAFTHGLTQPFDLVAPGGSDNVWVVEVGRAADGTFAEFQADLLGAAITNVGGVVTFASPSQGAMRWDSDTGALQVKGQGVATADYPRFDTPWVRAPFDARMFEIAIDDATLTLDFDTLTRNAS